MKQVAFAENVKNIVAADETVIGLAVAGSWLTNELDEYADLDLIHKKLVKQWQSASVRDWAKESMSYRAQTYTLPENKKLSYSYSYHNFYTIEMRLLQAGTD